MDSDLIKALACAIATLDGTAGGYTPREKIDAKLKLQWLLQIEETKPHEQPI